MKKNKNERKSRGTWFGVNPVTKVVPAKRGRGSKYKRSDFKKGVKYD